MHIPWSDVQMFIAIAERGSLSAAAKQLQVTQPTISRRLAELERVMGEPLFQRTVEGTSLTSFGEQLMEPARRMAEHAGEVERVASGASRAPSGVVRITAPPGVAWEIVTPFAAFVRKKLPDIRIEVSANTNYVDLARGEADLAIRFDKPPVRELVLLATLRHRVGAFAAKSYVERLPRKYAFADVDWIGWPPALGHLAPNPQLAAMIPNWTPVFTSNDYLVQLRAAEAGIGAVILSREKSKHSLPSPLVPLNFDYGKIMTTSYLVCARSALAIPRVRAVADLLVEELSS